MRLLLDECVPALVLDAKSSELSYLLPLMPALEAALENLVLGSYVLVAEDA